MKWLFLGIASLAASACAPTPTVSASIKSPVELLPASPTKGTLFTYYQARAESNWKNNWTAGLDFTGVSWNDPRCATLIAPSYVVMAAHFMRDSHTPVMFHDRMGQPVERYIVAGSVLNSVGDIAVGKLNMPVPRDIKTYRFASPADATPGTPVITTDQTMTASIHKIYANFGRAISFAFDDSIPQINRRNLIVGDSGHPTFILKNGDLLLLETHTTGGPGAGPNYSDPTVQAAIANAMKQLGN